MAERGITDKILESDYGVDCMVSDRLLQEKFGPNVYRMDGCSGSGGVNREDGDRSRSFGVDPASSTKTSITRGVDFGTSQFRQRFDHERHVGSSFVLGAEGSSLVGFGHGDRCPCHRVKRYAGQGRDSHATPFPSLLNRLGSPGVFSRICWAWFWLSKSEQS